MKQWFTVHANVEEQYQIKGANRNHGTFTHSRDAFNAIETEIETLAAERGMPLPDWTCTVHPDKHRVYLVEVRGTGWTFEIAHYDT